MIDFLWAMGPYLLPLLALSVYGVGLILHKRQVLRKARPLGPEAFDGLLTHAAGVARAYTGVADTHPLNQLLSHSGEAPNLLQARAQALLARLEDRVSYFPALANVATLSGLFGTVCGMIGAFLSLRSGGGADPSSLAGGLGQALVATALGLVTAIPSLAAYAIFQKRIQAVAGQMEALLSVLLPQEGRRA
jgi:biopolymer transport protein ExbB